MIFDNIHFKDRAEAGRLLAKRLEKYKGEDVIVYALPRGGVVTAYEIAKHLAVPLDLIITRKISHPANPEYAIAATAENGHIVGNPKEIMTIDEDWLEEEIEKERKESVRRREKYLHGRKMFSPVGKTAIIVDDGVATGLTLRVAILEIKHHNPKKIIVAVPVVPATTAKVLKSEAHELVALDIPPDDKFLGAVGAYYDEFGQVEDSEVIKLLEEHKSFVGNYNTPREFVWKRLR